MREIGLRQHDLAEALGMHAPALSLILNGRRAMPADFIERANAVVDRHEKAEEAAEQARAQALAAAK